MPKPSHRGRIVEAGLKVMFRKGYGGAGVRDIVAEASVPQGSFTNHFRSKEEFAREVLDLYFVDLKRLVAEVLDDANRRPRERLRRYLDLITDRLVEAEFSRGCLIGDFSLEAAPQSEMLRTRLGEIFAEWRTPFGKPSKPAAKRARLVWRKQDRARPPPARSPDFFPGLPLSARGEH